jgi:hypothetical protein
MLVLLSLAFADPARCTASWTLPVTGCQVRGPIRVEATGPSETGAHDAAVEHLAHVLALEGEAARLRSTMLTAADYGTCEDAAAHVIVTCFPEPALAGRHLCFADFASRECWTGDVMNFEASGVRALDAGRDRMCDAVDERLVQLSYTDLPLRRATCKAKCEEETRVRCPAQ